MATQYKGVPEGASGVIPRLVCRDVRISRFRLSEKGYR